jgi:putative hydrolase of the HAD superfamily
VIDFGCVISYPQPASDVAVILAAVGGDREAALERFWRHRLDYDRGDLSDDEFWSLVCHRTLEPTGPEVAELVRLDVASWSHVRPETLAAIDEFASRGLRLALLSNTPAPHAQWMLAQPWAARFEAHVFSYQLRVVKPDAAIYVHALTALGVGAAQAVFIDDRLENCEGARAVGLAAVHFTDPADWDEVRRFVTPAVA